MQIRKVLSKLYEDYKMPLSKFTIGSYYKSKTYKVDLIHIVARVDSTIYGDCYLAESSSGEFRPIRVTASTSGWELSTWKEWNACFVK